MKGKAAEAIGRRMKIQKSVRIEKAKNGFVINLYTDGGPEYTPPTVVVATKISDVIDQIETHLK